MKSLDCLFCKIINGDIPSEKVYEDDMLLAFKDIDPKAPFHAVIVPKVHIGSTVEINEKNSKYIAAIFEAAAKIAEKYNLEDGFRIVNNCGKDGGQTVGHIHFHMLGGRLLAWPPG